VTNPPPARTDALVEVRGLRKAYGTRRVLHDVHLDVARGAVTAVVGPNGAGKTTLNKILLGLVRPDTGTLRFDGTDMVREIQHRERFGYMPQMARFPDNFTARDVLALLTDLRGSSRTRDESLLEAFALPTFLDQPVRSLSGGQRQRLNAAAAFLFSPDLLLLDEPTAGLDPLASGILKDKIREVRAEGRAILITSHVLSELEEFADIVVFLHEGEVRWSGPLPLLLERTGGTTLERAIAELMRRRGPAHSTVVADATHEVCV
jgi:Cu-processing system ATP-binding protein